ncbi:MAG: VWA domain-containing protein [Planctomycetia bacterium]|nr:VWA domain-containing protein [Planctomycetia bacterium]
MSLAAPAALFLALLAIPIIVFYILKIRLRRVPVSTVIFWQQIFEEKQPRSIWQHLRHLLSLLVQLLFLMLLVFALGQPFFNWEILAARRLVLVVDNSASMNATDAVPTRLDAAKKIGRDLISGLRFRDELAIVAGGTEPHVVCGLSGHERTLLKALDDLPATDGPTRVGEAVALARNLIGGRSNAQVIVLTDGCFEGLEHLARAADVRIHSVGRRTNNVGITRFQVRRSLLDPTGYQILMEVANAGDDPVECRLELDLDDDVVDVVPLKLEPGGRWSQTLDKTSTSGGRLTARIDHADALSADNRAWALLPKREPLKVVLATEPNLFLEKVLEANPLVQLQVVREAPQQVPAETVLILHRMIPERIPPGPVFVIDPAAASDLWELGEPLENPIVTKQDRDSLLMTHVRLDNVVMPQAKKLTFSGHAHVLAGAVSNDPVYASIERPSGKVLVLTVNLDQGDLPLRTAFPILMTNALAWFSGAAGELREALATGAVTEVALPGNPATGAAATQAPALQLWPPGGGSPRPLPAGLAQAVIGPFDQCGVWSIAPAGSGVKSPAPAGAPTLEIACNLGNREESDLRPTEAALALVPAETLAAGWMTRPIWYYLVILAWVLAGLEWYPYQRRWIS